jgi:DNA-binding response OmpR family regulator
MSHNAASGKSILYVDDDVVVLTAYRDRLQKAGFDVESSVDGLETMRILSARMFDLIVLDLMLPRFSGAEVLKAVRGNARLKSIPVVIFSSNLETAQKSVLELADKSLLKGNCSFATMLETIQDLLAEAF